MKTPSHVIFKNIDICIKYMSPIKGYLVELTFLIFRCGGESKKTAFKRLFSDLHKETRPEYLTKDR